VLRLPLEDIKAIVLCASQKTLPISLTVIEFLPESAGTLLSGFVFLPVLIVLVEDAAR
jgi:hypothetical protein